jgi:hypothetical protein
MRLPIPMIKTNPNRCGSVDFDGTSLSWTLILWLILLIFCSFALRFAYVVWVTPLNKDIPVSLNLSDVQYDTDYLKKGGDEVDYFQIAFNLLSGRGYSRNRSDQTAIPTGYRPP